MASIGGAFRCGVAAAAASAPVVVEEEEEEDGLDAADDDGFDGFFLARFLSRPLLFDRFLVPIFLADVTEEQAVAASAAVLLCRPATMLAASRSSMLLPLKDMVQLVGTLELMEKEDRTTQLQCFRDLRLGLCC